MKALSKSSFRKVVATILSRKWSLVSGTRRVLFVASVCNLAPLLFRDAHADVIDFERTALRSAIPSDDADLVNPYPITIDGVATGGTVRFFFDLNGNKTYDASVDRVPKFERAGQGSNPTYAFASQWLNPDGHDTPRTGYESQLGDFFLRKPSTLGNGKIPGPFIALYDTTLTVTELSGEIWDVDGDDEWRVDVLDANNNTLASQISPTFAADNFGLDTLDSLPWQFQFTGLLPGVRSVQITFLGSDEGNRGFAFNNFSPTFAQSLSGDYNRNGIVDAADYVAWRKSLGSTTNLVADGNRDGVVDAADYMFWRVNFGLPSASGLNFRQIPEPSAIAISSLAMMFVILRAGRLR